MGRRGDAHPAGSEPLVPPMATLQIQVERKEKIRAGDVLGALTGVTGYQRRQGRQDHDCRIFNPMSPFSVMWRKPRLRHLSSTKIKGQDGARAAAVTIGTTGGRRFRALARRRWPAVVLVVGDETLLEADLLSRPGHRRCWPYRQSEFANGVEPLPKRVGDDQVLDGTARDEAMTLPPPPSSP